MAYASLGRVRVEWLKGVRRLLTHGVVVEKWLPGVKQHGDDLYFDLNERGQRDFASTVQSVFERIVIEELEDAMHTIERDFLGKHGSGRIRHCLGGWMRTQC